MENKPPGPRSSLSCPPVWDDAQQDWARCSRDDSFSMSCPINEKRRHQLFRRWRSDKESRPLPYCGPPVHHQPFDLTQHRMSFAFSTSVKIGTKLFQVLRLVWFQVVLVSVIVTLSRGVVNALNAVGAYGTGDVNTAITVNIISSMTFSCLSWLSGAVVNVIGCRAGCLIGGFTTSFLLASLMGASIMHVLPLWVVWFAAAIDGVGSGVLWTSIGAVTIKYPDANRKGFASTILFSIFSTGAALGGLVSFAMNASSGADTVSDTGSSGGRPVPTVSRSRISSVMIMSPSVEDNVPIATSSESGIMAGPYLIMVGVTGMSILLSLLVLPETQVRHLDGRSVLTREEDDPLPLARNMSRPSRMSSSFRLFSDMLSPVRCKLSLGEQSYCDRMIISDGCVRPRDTSGVSNFSETVLLEPNTPQPQSRCGDTAPPMRWSNELHQLVDTLQERSVQFLIFFSFASLFHQTYLFNGINYSTFNVRSRGLNCFMYWLGRIPAGFVHGYVVDDFRLSFRARAFLALGILVSHMIVAQLLTLFFWGKAIAADLDFATSPALTAHAFTAFFLYGGLDTISQSFAMWLFSLLGKDRPWRIPHYVAIYRTFQGFGVAFAWALDLNSFTPYQTQFVICVSFWVLALPGLIRMICDLPDKSYMGTSLREDSRCPACDHFPTSRPFATTTTGVEGECNEEGFGSSSVKPKG